MMDSVRYFEQARRMHPSVRPVKPSVMREQGDEDRNRPPPQRIIGNVTVNERPTQIVPAPRYYSGRHAVDRSTGKAPIDFASDLRFKSGVKSGMLHPCGERKATACE